MLRGMTILEIIGLVSLIAIVITAVAVLAAPLFGRGAPFLATRTDRVKTALMLANIQPGEQVIDLGSGDGRFVIAAAKRGAQAMGYEINPWLVWQSRRRGATVIWGSLWQADLSKFDVVFLFFLPVHLPNLEQKLRKELKPGARVVSVAFPLPTWEIAETDNNVYLYQRSLNE